MLTQRSQWTDCVQLLFINMKQTDLPSPLRTEMLHTAG